MTTQWMDLSELIKNYDLCYGYETWEDWFHIQDKFAQEKIHKLSQELIHGSDLFFCFLYHKNLEKILKNY